MQLEELKNDRQLLRFVIEKLFTFGELSPNRFEGVDASVGNILCPFHDNRNSPAAKMYFNNRKNINTIYCYKDNIVYTAYDYISRDTYHNGRIDPGKDPYEYLISHKDKSIILEIMEAVSKGYATTQDEFLNDKIIYIDNLFNEVDCDITQYIERLYTET